MHRNSRNEILSILRTNVLFVLKFSHVLLRRRPASSRNDPTTAKPKLYNSLCTYILRFSVCCSTYDKQNGKNRRLVVLQKSETSSSWGCFFHSHKFKPLFTFDMLDFFFLAAYKLLLMTFNTLVFFFQSNNSNHYPDSIEQWNLAFNAPVCICLTSFSR